MNFDYQIEKLYRPENFLTPCPKCERWEDDHDEDGACLVLEEDDTTEPLFMLIGRIGGTVYSCERGFLTKKEALSRIKELYLAISREYGDTLVFKNEVN